MSKTLFVDFRGQGFWAFDAVSGIFLKHLIDVAEARIADQNESWLAKAVSRWRFNAICGDCGLFLDENWSAEQIRSVRGSRDRSVRTTITPGARFQRRRCRLGRC